MPLAGAARSTRNRSAPSGRGPSQTSYWQTILFFYACPVPPEETSASRPEGAAPGIHPWGDVSNDLHILLESLTKMSRLIGLHGNGGYSTLVQPHRTRARSQRVKRAAAGPFVHSIDRLVAQAAAFRPATPHRVRGRHRAPPMGRHHVGDGEGRKNGLAMRLPPGWQVCPGCYRERRLRQLTRAVRRRRAWILPVRRQEAKTGQTRACAGTGRGQRRRRNGLRRCLRYAQPQTA